jgi:hypothetical protein
MKPRSAPDDLSLAPSVDTDHGARGVTEIRTVPVVLGLLRSAGARVMKRGSLVLSLGLPAAVVLSFAAPDSEQDAPPPAKPRFGETEVVSTNEGHATLSWTLPSRGHLNSNSDFQLQQSRDPGFANHRVRHMGPERSFFVSGLRGGRTYFRVRAVVDGSPPGPWSDTLVVDVEYPGNRQVVLLLAVGCVVLATTAAAILTGWARNRRGTTDPNRARV